MSTENITNPETGSVSKLLNINTGSIVAVVGCGGKTSLIEQIARENDDKKVLISPTTKTLPIFSEEVILCDTLKKSVRHKPVTGVQCLGQYNERNGKLEALPENILKELAPLYDIVLMEADGSRWLPCKGWLEDEPVIPPYSTHTVGVVTMDAVGKAATEDIVHHLPEFLSLADLNKGEIITEQVLEDMICLEKGMFKNSIGLKYLLVNKTEDEADINIAITFLNNIKKKYPNDFERLIYGSIRRKTWQEV